MDRTDPPKSDIHELVSRVMADDATAEDWRQLSHLLEHSSEAVREYAEAVSLAAQLNWTFSQKQTGDQPTSDNELGDLPVITPSSSRARPTARLPFLQRSRDRWARNLRYPQAILAATLLIAIGGVAGIVVGPRLAIPGLTAANRSMSGNNASAAGNWSRAVNCSWMGDLQTLPIAGSEVQSGERIALLQGVAELRLNNGTDLKVDGPTAMVVASPSSLVIQHGSVHGSVPVTARALEISVPSGLLEIGTGEFGLTVYGDTIEIHAFTSRVGLTLSSFGRTPEGVANSDEETDFSAPQEVSINPGQALRLQLSGASLRVAETKQADRSRFVSARSELSPLHITSSYVEQVEASQPVAFWRFESAMLSNSLGNEVEGGQSLNMTGNIQLRTQEGNSYLDFPVGDWDDRIVASEPFKILDGADTYSIEFWMRPNHLHHGMVCGLIDSPFTDPHSGVIIELNPGVYSPNGTDTGLVRFLHRTPPSGNYRVGVSAYSKERYALRKWQHIVAVKVKQQLRLYLNGKLSGTAECGDAVSNDLYVVIGQLHRPKYMRAFVGQLDELAIYDRALTSEEVQGHHAAVSTDGAEYTMPVGDEI